MLPLRLSAAVEKIATVTAENVSSTLETVSNVVENVSSVVDAVASSDPIELAGQLASDVASKVASTDTGREAFHMAGSALEGAGQILEGAGQALKELPGVAVQEAKPKSLLEEYGGLVGGIAAAAAVVAATYYLTRPASVPPQVDLDAQSHVIMEPLYDPLENIKTSRDQ
ncbi:uncharacterized protein [Palaemon carinicauda]|uniref:uncharacterized protein n=1 Tax=Palaemon carinicauda TaxID=392227 RepID=UPI0035B6898F